MPSEIHEKIINHGLLTEWFGYWPDFHDFEITRIEMDRSVPLIVMEIYGFQMLSEVDEKGYYKLSKKCLITLKFTYMPEMLFDGFNLQNALASLRFEQKDGLLKTEIFSNNGMGGFIISKNVEVVSVKPIDKPPEMGKGEIVSLLPMEKEKLVSQHKKPAGEKKGMVSATVSLVLGIMCFIMSVPKILPFFGLVFGANAILKQLKKPVKDKQVIVMAIIGIVLSLFVYLIFLLHDISE